MAGAHPVRQATAMEDVCVMTGELDDSLILCKAFHANWAVHAFLEDKVAIGHPSKHPIGVPYIAKVVPVDATQTAKAKAGRQEVCCEEDADEQAGETQEVEALGIST